MYDTMTIEEINRQYWDTLMAYADAANLIFEKTGDKRVFDSEYYTAVVDELYRLSEPVEPEEEDDDWWRE